MKPNIIGTGGAENHSELSEAASTMVGEGDRVRGTEHTEPSGLPLAAGPAYLPAYAAAGVPLAGLGSDLGQMGAVTPLLGVGLAVAAVIGGMRAAGSGRQRRRRRGISLSPRTRARLRMHPGHGFATRGQLYRHYGRLPARRVAKFGRPSLTTRDRWVGPRQEYAAFHGRAQGLIHRWGVYSTFEDLTLMIAPPQEGKSQKTAASIIDAPGPLVVTSIRGDLIRATAGLRQQVGYTFIFNPEGVGAYASNMRWNPVAGCQDIVTAVRRAGYMVEASENKGLADGAFWSDIGTMALASLMHASALIGGTLRDVHRWLVDRQESETALRILTDHDGASEVAERTIHHVANEMAEKTRDGVITTLSRVLRFMIDPNVVEILCPRVQSIGDFDFESFLRSKDTIYLVSGTDGQSMSAPVFSAFLAELATVANIIGNECTGPNGQRAVRLDPPLTIEGDELGNTAPVPVDRWASWAAGSGIRINMYFQSYARIVERWGKEGAEALWGSSKVKIIGSGVTEEAVLNKMSRLIGKIDVREEDEITHDRWGRERKRPRWSEVEIMSAAEIRRIPPGKALILRSAAAAPTIVTLDALRRRKAFKEWVKAGAPVDGLVPVTPREIPRVQPELRNPRAAEQAELDEMTAWRKRRHPDAAPPLPLPRPTHAKDPAEGRPQADAEPEQEQETVDVPPGWSPWQRRTGGNP